MDFKRRALVSGDGDAFRGKTFLIQQGKRHWVAPGWLAQQSELVYPDDVVIISDELLAMFQAGQPAVRRWDASERSVRCALNADEARELAASQLQGCGLEIGAGAAPFPIPIDCAVTYGDIYSYDELLTNAYAGQSSADIVAPTVRTELATLSNVPDSSQDFIVACHVIEHTRDPIGAIINSLKKLREGGSLVLVIPDMSRTFDRHRALTNLDHLIVDYHYPSAQRDEEHYRDFYANAEGFLPVDDSYEVLWRAKMEEEYSIHFHTWTYESFSLMVEWIDTELTKFSQVWSMPTRGDGIEFYFTMTK